jgi:hypothetical protein
MMPSFGDPEIGPSGPVLNTFFTKVRFREAAYTTQTAAALPNFLLIPGQKLKLNVDAVLDEILAKTSL